MRKAYHTLARKYHPDQVSPDRKGWAAEKMRALNRAFAVLGDPARRAEYDRQREELVRVPAQPAAPARVAAGPGDWCAFHTGVRAQVRCDRCHRPLCSGCAHQRDNLTLCSFCVAMGEAVHCFVQGQKYLEVGANYEAAKAFREVLRLDPQSAGAHYNLGLALLHLGMNDEAVKSLQRAAELQPMTPEVHIAHARALAAKGHFEESIKAYRRGLSMAPEEIEAAFELGMLLARVKAHREAYAAFDEVAKREPGNARAVLMQAKMLALLERYRAASRLLDRALTLNPGLGGELRDFPFRFRVRYALRRLLPIR